MNINRANYEIYFLDYLEGSLSKDLEKEYLDFLHQNPDLKNELEDYDNMKIPLVNAKFPDKEKLKKEEKICITNDSFEDLCIAYYEGDLETEEKNILLEFIHTYPEKEKIFKIYERLKFKPDNSIYFNRTSSLKRIELSVWRIIYRYAIPIASVILIGFFSHYFYLNSHKFLTDPSLIRSQVISTIPNKISTEINPQVKLSQALIKANKKTYKKPNENVNFTYSSDTIYEIEMNKLQFISATIDPPVQVTRISLPIKNNTMKKDDYLTLQKYLMTEINKRAKKQLHIDDGRLTAWNILDLGLKGVKSLLGYNIKIERKYDNLGNLAQIDVESEYFAFKKPIK